MAFFPILSNGHNSICTRVSKNRVERKSFNSLGMMTKEKFARLDWRAGPTLFCGGEVGFEEDGGWDMERLEGEDLSHRTMTIFLENCSNCLGYPMKT